MVIRLRVRPRWKRALIAPRLFRQYRNAGCGRWLSVRMVWMAVSCNGRWQGEA
jgi:hypothetical protein